MASMLGKWTFVSQENLENFLSAVGLPDEMKKMALSNKPELVISKDGDTYTIKTTVGEQTKECKFKSGEQFEGMSIAMKPMKSVVAVEDTKMVETQTIDSVTVTITRQVKGNELTSTMKVNNVVAVLKFSKA